MNTKTVFACSAIVIAFALIVAPLAMSEDALAKKSNKAKQSISQSQSSSQSSQSVGSANFLSGNNVNLQGQFNSGSNSLAQNNN
ncbi:hypothetical protein [Candidatus Nitrosocosmicus arcticus]|uniref:Uncharacterized protein n=1 Tax=Candidatus Nitrosocosmicus arcticus TaxID=2035267 RepID=A0A557SYI6_9ARCH|nr:hypothetical protein [Candidatus Nitrosocosmicus arcticus]TVP41666.1 exported protein of unknown function [Candidatus Nitrosocosmicus arcticus]